MNAPLSGQWADALLLIEQLHWLKLLAWGGISVLSGTVLLALLRFRQADSPLLSGFAVQALAWGVFEIAVALWARQSLALRDLSSAVALDRLVWFNVGLAVGGIGIGMTLALLGQRLGPRPGLIGAGLGVAVQGLALVVLELQLAAGIVR